MHIDTTHHDETLAYPELRPSPQILQLLIRAAVVDDGRGGPWLSVIRTHTTTGQRIYTHHIHLFPIDLHSGRRLVLLSGDEVLSYCRHQRISLTEPTGGQLRRLGTYAVELQDAPGWERHYPTWYQTYTAAALDRQESTDLAAADARAVRWAEAERCLARPTEA